MALKVSCYLVWRLWAKITREGSASQGRVVSLLPEAGEGSKEADARAMLMESNDIFYSRRREEERSLKLHHLQLRRYVCK